MAIFLSNVSMLVSCTWPLLYLSCRGGGGLVVWQVKGPETIWSGVPGKLGTIIVVPALRESKQEGIREQKEK